MLGRASQLVEIPCHLWPVSLESAARLDGASPASAITGGEFCPRGLWPQGREDRRCQEVVTEQRVVVAPYSLLFNARYSPQGRIIQSFKIVSKCSSWCLTW